MYHTTVVINGTYTTFYIYVSMEMHTPGMGLLIRADVPKLDLVLALDFALMHCCIWFGHLSL